MNGVETFKEALDKDWYGQTTLHPLALAAVMLFGTALLLVPRRCATWPLLAMACFIAPAQRLVVAGFDFNMLRLMVLFGWIRVLFRGEIAGFRARSLDLVFLAFVVVGVTVYTVQWGTSAALVYRLGWAYDTVGMYFLFRVLVRDLDDLAGAATGAALLALPVAAAFLVERATARNLFSVFGGVREITMLRNGRLRCQGAFAHPIMAGTFWAVLLPLIGALWWRSRRARRLAVVGGVAALVIIITCSSSGPMATVMAVVVGALAWHVRSHLRTIRWGILGMLVLLHIVMNKPVWHLIARIDLVGGSTGWHRYFLIDRAIAHFPEWALLGTRSTAHWGQGLYDITNEYVLHGIRGGALSLALFIALIVLAFRNAGRLRRFVAGDAFASALAWGLGVMMLGHVISFIGASYFGQIDLVWYLPLAALASLVPARRTAPRARPASMFVTAPARPAEATA